VKNFPIHSVLQVIQLVSSILLVLAVLLQTPKSSSGLGGTIGGGGGDSGGGYRTRRGIENTLFQITIGLTIIFVIVSVVNIKIG
jgi:preprotein translocase subunit SecG